MVTTRTIEKWENFPASHAILIQQYLGLQNLLTKNDVLWPFVNPILGFLGIDVDDIISYPLEKDGKMELKLRRGGKLIITKSQELWLHNIVWESTFNLNFDYKSSHYRIIINILGKNETVYRVSGEGEGNDSYSSPEKIEREIEELLDQIIIRFCKLAL